MHERYSLQGAVPGSGSLGWAEPSSAQTLAACWPVACFPSCAWELKRPQACHIYSGKSLLDSSPPLSLLVVAALCRGRVVRVPAASLVRVVGTELVIPCNVSDYDGPSEQNFDWSFSASGSSFVELASTWEAGFPAPQYRERLQRGDILLRRTANDAVELHIKNVQHSDQGHYKCSTPSTDATVQGNYEDTVQVKGTSSWEEGDCCARDHSSLCYPAVSDCARGSAPSSAQGSNSILPHERQRMGQGASEIPLFIPR